MIGFVHSKVSACPRFVVISLEQLVAQMRRYHDLPAFGSFAQVVLGSDFLEDFIPLQAKIGVLQRVRAYFLRESVEPRVASDHMLI
jgi:hypothetical protein